MSSSLKRCFRSPHLFLVVLFVGWSLALSARAANFYINANGAQGNGSGSSAANAASATPGNYNSIVSSHNVAGTTIIYAPGTYYVYPAMPMYSGVTHQGSGIDSTFIKIPDGAASGSFAPMFLANGSTISSFKFTDATFDFNSNKTAWWTQGTGMSMGFAFSLADHCTLQRLKFINLGAKNEEAFPVFFDVSGSAAGNMNNNLVDSCIFTQPTVSGNTNGGLTCIQMADSLPSITTDLTNVVSNNQFLNLKYPQYSDLPYAQCCSCPVAKNNIATGVDSLWFVEPGSSTSNPISTFTGITVQVTGNTLTDSGEIALILMHPNGTFGNLNVQNNIVGMTQTPYQFQGFSVPTGFAVTQYQSGNPAVGNLNVQDNTFIAPLPRASSPVAVQANPTSPALFHMASLAVNDNVFVNFPQNGKQFNVTATAALNPSYTHSGNIFLDSLASRLMHAGVAYDVPLAPTGTVGIEDRHTAGLLQIVAKFSIPIASGTATITGGGANASVLSTAFSGTQVTVNLTGIADKSRLNIALTALNGDSGILNIPVDTLEGDTNADGVVSTADGMQLNSHVGQAVNIVNFRMDLNLDGTVNVGDAILLRNDIGHTLP